MPWRTFYIDIMIGAGEGSRSVHLELPPFTLIGATTRAGMLSNPLRARFGLQVIWSIMLMLI